MSSQVRTPWLFILSAGVGLFCLGLNADVVNAQKNAGAKSDNQKRSGDEEAIRASAKKFLDLFRGGDAKALAAAWTENGEYINDEGVVIQGRPALEQAYKDFFAKRKPVSVEAKIDSIRFLGRDTAMEEGTFSMVEKEGEQPIVSRYSALHVREDGQWRMASLREWPAEPAAVGNPLEKLTWLAGKWTAKNGSTELKLTYAWGGDEHNFLENHFTVLEAGKPTISGLQVIGRDPVSGDLRSWAFDSKGGIAEGLWTLDKGRWLIDSTQTAADGSILGATNILLPGGADNFVWQSTASSTTAGGTGGAPLKVMRVKGQ